MALSCFKVYDIPGQLGDELNEQISYRIGRAYAEHLAYPCSGEINCRADSVDAVLKRTLAHFAPLSPEIDCTDRISLEFPDFRFNPRASNTEPLFRLNVETHQNIEAVELQVREIENLFCNAS